MNKCRYCGMSTGGKQFCNYYCYKHYIGEVYRKVREILR